MAGALFLLYTRRQKRRQAGSSKGQLPDAAPATAPPTTYTYSGGDSGGCGGGSQSGQFVVPQGQAPGIAAVAAAAAAGAAAAQQVHVQVDGPPLQARSPAYSLPLSYQTDTSHSELAITPGAPSAPFYSQPETSLEPAPSTATGGSAEPAAQQLSSRAGAGSSAGTSLSASGR